MEFLFPGFLFALPLVAIPVIIHLFNFRRYIRVEFSNVSFLREMKQQSSAPRNLQRIWLLAFRALTLIFLILAFSRPYFPAGGTTAGSAQPAIISIYVDNSPSMEMQNREGSLLDAARRRALEIASAYGLNHKFQLLTNDFEGKYQRLMDYEDFVSAAGDIKGSVVRRTLPELLGRQEDLLSGFRGQPKICYLISDFQRNLLVSGKLKDDKDVQVRLVKLSATPQPNISVDSVWFVSPVHRPSVAERLVVRLKNNSGSDARNIPMRVTVDGRQQAIGSLSIPAEKLASDTLSFAGLSPGWKQAEVTISDYPVTFDDRYFFSFFVRDSMPLLIINNEADNRYLQALFAAEPFFSVTTSGSGNVNYGETARYPAIILNGTADMTAGLAQQLKSYVVNGGSLIVFPSLPGNLEGLRILSSELGTDYPEGISTAPTKVSRVNFRHPVFSGVFSGETGKQIDLPSALNYVQYTRKAAAGGDMIMELPGRRPFFTQYNRNRGRIYLSAVSAGEGSSNLVTHSLFVPLMYQCAFLSLRDQPLAYTTGNDSYIALNGVIPAGEGALRLKGEKTEIIPDLVRTESGMRLFVADQVRRGGHYRLLNGNRLLACVAFNESREESDMHYAGEKELLALFPPDAAQVFEPQGTSLDNMIKAANNGVELWKLCIILALVFLAAEIVLLRFYGRTTAGNIELIK